ncbi:MutS-related protein [Pedobacter nutrimenti]|uniref:MutS-related protein n=1 Tax=Pedobacter nutrimenti TaxID=1241337 RepID=UPI00292CE215|nr:hypothetical protein [Pedobacter nutrimenti]
MIYLLGIPVVLILLWFFIRFKRQQEMRKRAEEVITKWSQPSEHSIDFKQLKGYCAYFAQESGGHLSDAIAADIDLENLFAYIDRTNSKPGQQYLYQKLRSGKKDPEALKQLDLLAEQFAADEHLRISTEIELSALGSKNAYYIHELFTTSYQALYSGWISLYIRFAALLWIASVVLTVVLKNQMFFLLSLGLTLFNFYLHYGNKKKISSYVHSLPQLYKLMRAAERILKLVVHPDAQSAKASLKELAPLQRSLSMVNFQDKTSGDPTDLSASALELIKTFLLVEPAMFLKSVNRINQQRSNIEILFNFIGQTDMAISVLSLRTGLPYYCKPDFSGVKEELKVTDLYHPLVENCVANSIKVKAEQGVLITGSNMSGKTTFIRSLVINALLSQTLYTSCSNCYSAPFMNLFTSIRMSDDLEEHKSYFQAEALSILDIVNKTMGQKESSLILIDEIFRGTNTIERVAAAKAILSYLTAHKNFTFVSTHDLELAELLGKEYAVYSFEELVSETRLVFDYKIKPGVLKNKNGLAILSSMGYPQSIIEDATAISTVLRKKYDL